MARQPETNLQKMLATLDVRRRPGTFAFVSSEDPALKSVAQAVITEDEGTTLVVPIEHVQNHQSVEFAAAWLTLSVYSALDAVGLTAAVSSALADHQIPCNMLAGFYHDHLLIPQDRVDDAIAVLNDLRDKHSSI
jgi:hypothetical protein